MRGAGRWCQFVGPLGRLSFVAADLTFVILTLNEADRVDRAVKSLPKGSRLVVIDSFSTDGTLEAIARAWSEGGRRPEDLALIKKAWPGFVRARNESLAWVTTEWVFWLDADEWLSAELAQELDQVAKLPADVDVWECARLSTFLGREIRHGGWYPDRKRRLARAKYAQWTEGPYGSQVHENLVSRREARTERLRGELGHEPFRDEKDQADTNDRYSTLLAEGLAKRYRENGKRAPSEGYIAVKAAVKFIENYVWKLGMLDGHAGYVIARGSAKSLKLRLTKLRGLLS